MAGRIKAGEKRTNPSGVEYPASLDHFVMVAQNHEYVRIFRELYGDKPVEIPIVFYADGPETLAHYYELRDRGGKVFALSNGKEFKVSSENGMKEMSREQAEPICKQWAKDNTTDRFRPEWREVCRLRFLLPATRIIGYFEFKTYGKGTSIPKLIGPYDLIMEQLGTVKNVPFSLRVTKHTSNQSGAAKSYPIVELICNLNEGVDSKLVGPGQVDQVRRDGAALEHPRPEDIPG